MILSHKYRFIFIKTAKTAGTSIEIALSEYCGAEDIITPIKSEDEQIRRSLGFAGPQNYVVPDTPATAPFAGQPSQTPDHKFYHHIPAAEIKALVDESVWSSYYKFCFERHPCERVISQYFWYRRQPRPTLSEFIDSNQILMLKRHGCDAYTIDGKVVVDKIGLYERLETDLEEIRVRVGLPQPLVLPRAKTRFRTDRRDFRAIMSVDDRAKVARIFAEEVALFGYEC
jgi:hypothetical protein